MDNREKEKEQFYKQIQANTLSMDDTFIFGCKMCGSCCRHRDEPIILTGYDVYNIAKGLGIEPADVVKEYTELYPGPDSYLPIVVLKERLDASCKLLRSGKCTVQENKPLVCRLYPLGRYSDGKEFKYFKQNACLGKGEEIRVGDWLEQFHIKDYDEVALLWGKLIISAAQYQRNLVLKRKDKKKAELFYQNCAVVFYIMYDMDAPPEESLKAGIEYLEKKFTGFKVK